MAKFNTNRGEKGVQGPIGPEGPQGLKGDKGNTGDTGTQGLKGDKGDTGSTGAQGLNGDKGDTGAQGPKGDTGDSGVSSLTSYTPTLSGTSMTFTSGNGSTGQVGNYLTVGKLCNFSANITLANVNTLSLVNATSGTSNFAITLPVNAAKAGLIMGGHVTKSDGKIYGIIGKTTANSNILTLWTTEKEIKALDRDTPLGASGWTTSYSFVFTGTYQTV
jgi:hypothetical protein